VQPEPHDPVADDDVVQPAALGVRGRGQQRDLPHRGGQALDLLDRSLERGERAGVRQRESDRPVVGQLGREQLHLRRPYATMGARRDARSSSPAVPPVEPPRRRDARRGAVHDPGAPRA
jgi:hypothetical protein